MAACALIVEFDLQPGAADAFLRVMTEHARLTRQEEPGCRQFDVLRPDDAADRVVLVEVYENRDAYELHRNGPRMPVVGAAIADLITGRRRTVCTVM